MKTLFVFKSEPDETTRALEDLVSEDEEITRFSLYGEDADYGKLVDLIFENEKVVCWW
ncbi:MAG TPA: hypothetical protein HPP59_02405 [Deltaproteobacteria bacterium]|nr:hypothetical protein [Deltaproteobacteria bacterium]